MKRSVVFLSGLAVVSLAFGEPDALTNGQAYLAATLAALSTPKMKEAPIRVEGAISRASGLQEGAGEKAIVAIPDEELLKVKFNEVGAGAVPICRLWLKGYGLMLAETKRGAVETKEVDAEGETHAVSIWLLGVRKGDGGRLELMVCANEKEPVMVVPLGALAVPTAADSDEPVRVEVKEEGEKIWLVLSMLGSHEVKLEME